MNVKRANEGLRTLQVSLSAVETLGREFVVAEGTQQFADHDVRLTRGLPYAHVFVHDGHSIAPLLLLRMKSRVDSRRHTVRLDDGHAYEMIAMGFFSTA